MSQRPTSVGKMCGLGAAAVTRPERRREDGGKWEDCIVVKGAPEDYVEVKGEDTEEEETLFVETEAAEEKKTEDTKRDNRDHGKKVKGGKPRKQIPALVK